MTGEGKKPKEAPELFTEQDAGRVITAADKLAAAKREIAFRERAYPKWVDSGKLSQDEADEQLALMKAIRDDYDIRAWPQLTRFTPEWLPTGQRLTFLDVPVKRMTRDELIALVGYCREALEEIAGKGE